MMDAEGFGCGVCVGLIVGILFVVALFGVFGAHLKTGTLDGVCEDVYGEGFVFDGHIDRPVGAESGGYISCRYDFETKHLKRIGG